MGVTTGRKVSPQPNSASTTASTATMRPTRNRVISTPTEESTQFTLIPKRTYILMVGSNLRHKPAGTREMKSHEGNRRNENLRDPSCPLWLIGFDFGVVKLIHYPRKTPFVTHAPAATSHSPPLRSAPRTC